MIHNDDRKIKNRGRCHGKTAWDKEILYFFENKRQDSRPLIFL